MPKKQNKSKNNDHPVMPSDMDESSLHDPLALSFWKVREDALRFDLFDLESLLYQLVWALENNHREGLLGIMGIIGGPRSDVGIPEIRQFLQTRYMMPLTQALKAFESPTYAERFANNDGAASQVLEILACKSNFDMGHEMHRMSNAMMEGFSKEADEKSDLKVREFEQEGPLDKYQRQEEPGYTAAEKKAKALSCAEKANEAARKAWAAKRMWAAELFWKRATELGNEAKYWSNLAFVHIQLGRYLRSLGIGYRRYADEFLEAAISEAAKAVEIDPKWARGYQRGAEAHLALGPYDHAMDACKILKKAKEVTEQPNEALEALYDKARENARLWFALKLAPGTATIPEILDASLRNLRRAVVLSLPIDTRSDEDMKKAGDDIADAALVVMGALQLIYLRRSQWKRESDTDIADFQIHLRQVAKAVPLKAIQVSESLKKLTFMEDPFTLWGLERLDRKGVDSLPFDANDPCEGDDGDDEMFNEMLQRETGQGALGLSGIHDVLENFGGKGPFSRDDDMSQHHLCSFSFTLLQRVLTKPSSPLREPATQRLIDLYLVKNGSALAAGGEFVGMALNVAAGIPKYGAPDDPSRTAEFLQTHGGVSAMAKEINLSGDHHFFIQKALAKLTSEDWASFGVFDIVYLLSYYVCEGMDDNIISMESSEDISPYVATIMSALLDGYPFMIEYFRSGTLPAELSDFRPFGPMFRSAFGLFVCHKFMEYEQTLIDTGVPHNTKAVLDSLIEKWGKLSKNKRSGYRWETLDDETKRQFSNLAPVSKVDLMNARSGEAKENDGVKKKERVIKKLPHCANCGDLAGMGVVLQACACKAVKYCSVACQREHWSEHKKICKELRSSAWPWHLPRGD